jgi:hypothetical protein
MTDVALMDVYRIGSEYRIVVRDGANFNLFCLISMGTGQSNGPMHPKKLKAYLEGDNPHKFAFERVCNLRDVWHEQHPDFDPCVGIYVPDDVPEFSDKPVISQPDQYILKPAQE